jgi:TonB-linked SusC/RagA family outer membrane protein
MRSALLLAFLLFVGSISAQTVKVTVKDSQGEAVIGASVLEQGTRNGGVTDIDGNFTINLTAGKPVVISYIGMKTKTVNAQGKSAIDVVLEDDATTLQEVVAIGYGTMKRKDLTGSVSSVTGDALAATPVSNVSEALQGKLGGVNVIAQDGRPGAEMAIRVRGGGSITQSNDPLFIVDGIAVSTIDDIPADNIESIDVLKDASSTAIYGARGANGVILVTTKQAKEGKPQIKYNMYYQIKAKPKLLESQDAYTYVRKNWEYMTAVGYGDNIARYYGLGSANGNHLEEYRNVSSHNYMEDVFRSGNMWNHDLSLSGGTDKTKYYASVGYNKDDATMKNSGFSRWTINLKLQQAITKNLKLDVDARYNETKTQQNKFFQGSTSNINNTLVYPWMFNMIDNPLGNGATTEFGEGNIYAEQQYNPIDVINDNDYNKYQQRVRLNTALTWTVIKNLTAKSELSLSRNWSKTETWQGPKTGRELVSTAKLAQGDGYNTSWTTTLNYDFADLLKSDDHALQLLVGNEVLGSRSNSSTMFGYKYPNTWSSDMAFGQIQMAQDRNQSYFTNDIGVSSHTISWFGRANYNLLSRYMFTFTMRADGSSKFAAGKRWGYFPAGAIAWRISDEPFLADAQKWLDNLKLRLSIGTSGNDGIDPGAFIDEWVSKQNSNGSFSYTPGSLKGNPDLTWEKTISRNIGLDYGFLSGKFNGSIDFYWNTTKDCLMRVPINSIAGYSYQFQNAAKTSNKGIEFALNYNIIRSKDLDLSFGVTYNYNVNKVEEVPADANMDGSMRFASTSMNPSKPYLIEQGEPVGLIKGYKAAGFYTVDDFDVVNGVWTLKPGVADTKLTTYHGAENYKLADGQSAFPGMPKYEDTDGNGTVTNEDATIIGRMVPKHTGGFHLNARYKGFDFSANFTYQLDGKVFNANAARSVHSGNNTKWASMSRLDTKFDNSWKMYNIDANGNLYAVTDPEELKTLNAGAAYGLLGYISNDAPIISDLYVENAAFMRLQSLTIGYTLPKQLTSKIGINNARIYFTGGNLFCIKAYDGLDPDVNTNSAMDPNYSGFPTPGFDYNSYPKSRTFTFGLNVAF